MPDAHIHEELDVSGNTLNDRRYWTLTNVPDPDEEKISSEKKLPGYESPPSLELGKGGGPLDHGKVFCVSAGYGMITFLDMPYRFNEKAPGIDSEKSS